MGTAHYMSPEQARGLPIDARTDIFSLGVVLYRMVTGSLPFIGKTMPDVIASILRNEPPSLNSYQTDLPVELDRIVSKALRKDTEERYQSVADLLVDLEKLKQGLEFQTHLERLKREEESGPGQTAPEPTPVLPAASAAGVGINSELTLVRETLSGKHPVTEVGWRKLRAPLILATIIVAAVALAYLGYSRFGGPGNRAGISSLAVLSFTNSGDDPEKEYLSDGISESLINRLSQLPGMKVIANSSSSRYKSKDADPLAVGAALGVTAVLTGKVLQRGDDLLISVELIDARDRTQLWGRQYTRKAGDLLLVQETFRAGSLRPCESG